jgi:glutamate synthase domain-containing protein 2
MTFGGRVATAGLLGLLLLCALCAMLPGGQYLLAGIAALGVAVALRDRYQTREPLLRNYPLLGRLHGLLHLGGKLLGLGQPMAPYGWALVDLVRERAEGRAGVSAFGAQLTSPEVTVLHAVQPAPLDEVPERIVIGGAACARPYFASYLNISALAFGAISEPAIEALSRGAKAGGFFYNTGEAGLPACFLAGGGDLVWQLGTGYFGCRDRSGRFDEGAFRDKAALDAIKMIEVKLSQGAKPAKGGLLPGEKVTARVAEVCQIPAGKDSILPAHHGAFSSPIGLLELVGRLRDAAGGKPVGFKLCVGRQSDVFAIVKAMLATGIYPDFISVDGAEGGTGAAPLEFQSFVGTPLRLALPLVHDALVGVGLRDQIRIVASGKITTGADMVAAIAQGADLCAAARPFMLALGCMQALICASNRCPVGLATQDRRLTRGIVPETQAGKVSRFHRQTVLAFRELVAATGCASPADLRPAHLLHGATGAGMAPGQLVAGEPPAPYAAAWRSANPRHF